MKGASTRETVQHISRPQCTTWRPSDLWLAPLGLMLREQLFHLQSASALGFQQIFKEDRSCRGLPSWRNAFASRLLYARAVLGAGRGWDPGRSPSASFNFQRTSRGRGELGHREGGMLQCCDQLDRSPDGLWPCRARLSYLPPAARGPVRSSPPVRPKSPAQRQLQFLGHHNPPGRQLLPPPSARRRPPRSA